MVRVVSGVAEIDEIEVRSVDDGPAEVGAAEIGLANVLRGSIVLLVVVVRIESGPRSLTGDRAIDEVAAAS